MARQSGQRPGATNQGSQGRGGKQAGSRGPVFQDVLWLQRWPRLVSTLFIVLILLEILAFLWVAERIGLALTLLALIGSAVIGLWLIRRTGLDMVGKLRLSLAQGQEPGHSLVDGACFVVAGLLLILPGFFSDLMAILLMLPPTRNWLIRHLASKLMGAGFAAAGGATRGGKVITDVEFREVDPTAAASQPAAQDDPLDQPFARVVAKATEEPVTNQVEPTPAAEAEPAAEPLREAIAEPEILLPEKPAQPGPAATPEDQPAAADEADEPGQSPSPRPTPSRPADDDNWGRAPRRPVIDVEES